MFKKILLRIKFMFMKRKMEKRKEYTMWAYFGDNKTYLMEYRGIFHVMTDNFALKYFMVNANTQMKNFGIVVKRIDRTDMEFDNLGEYFSILPFDKDKIPFVNIGEDRFMIVKDKDFLYINDKGEAVETTVKEHYNLA